MHARWSSRSERCSPFDITNESESEIRPRSNDDCDLRATPTGFEGEDEDTTQADGSTAEMGDRLEIQDTSLVR